MSGRENERQTESGVGGEVVECNVQKAQWDTWSWCHSLDKVGLISLEAKLVFIGCLGGKRFVGESRKPGGKGHLRGRKVHDLSANCGH